MSAEAYPFRHGVAAFFDLPTRAAAALLPRHLVALERRPRGAVLSVAALDFHSSPVGPYRELVLSIAVAPHLEPGRALPKVALYPFVVATTTEPARRHGIERWRLPHFPDDIRLAYTTAGDGIELHASAGGLPVLTLALTGRAHTPVRDAYQVFVQDAHVARVVMEGRSSEHEEGTATLTLHRHALLAGLSVDEVEPTAFREQWMVDGVETFHPIEPVATATR